MDERNDASAQPENAPVKHAWQAQKESVYDKMNITVRQLDIIIGLAVAGLVIVAILIALDAMNII